MVENLPDPKQFRFLSWNNFHWTKSFRYWQTNWNYYIEGNLMAYAKLTFTIHHTLYRFVIFDFCTPMRYSFVIFFCSVVGYLYVNDLKIPLKYKNYKRAEVVAHPISSIPFLNGFIIGNYFCVNNLFFNFLTRVVKFLANCNRLFL